MMLVSGITGTAFAQRKTNSEKPKSVFEIPEGFISRRYFIDLEKGNKMQIEVTDENDLQHLGNMDSLISIFFKDIALLKDSLADELAAKKIDYFIDPARRKKIRIQTYPQQAPSFVIRQGTADALKTEQDTINITGIINLPAKTTIHKPFSDTRYYRISFFLNDIKDLEDYKDAGLKDKIAALIGAKKSRWNRDNNGDWHVKNGDKAVSAKNPGGFINGTGDYLTAILGAGVQNYKNNFVPSFTAGLQFVFNNGINKKQLSFSWDPAFVFAKDAAGKLQTYRNDFYTLRYSQSKRKEPDPGTASFTLNPNFSLSWLKKNRGNIFDKNTFRLGVGEFNLFKDKISIEPGLYFNNFFKDVTPSIKIGFTF